jgi:hypothetical protein
MTRRDTKMLMKICWCVFGVLLGLFIVTVSPLREFVHLQGDFRDFVVPLGVLGTSLIILVAITRMSLVLKCFLFTMGVSAAGWPITLFLHSVLIHFFPTEPFTYILFFFVYTPAFIIGAIGAIIFGIKQLFTPT